MKQELKTFVILNLFALVVWGVVGGVYGAYQALHEMGNVVWTTAFWLLLIMSLTLAGAIEYYAFRSLVQFLKALHRWFEIRDLFG